MSETADTTDTDLDVNGMRRVPWRERAAHYVETSFRTPGLATFLAWIRHGPGRTFIWGGEQWERSLTPKLHLPLATCQELGLTVLPQHPQAQSEWARLAREGHEVWQVFAHGRYLGVIADGVYHSYQEIDRAHHVT